MTWLTRNFAGTFKLVCAFIVFLLLDRFFGLMLKPLFVSADCFKSIALLDTACIRIFEMIIFFILYPRGNLSIIGVKSLAKSGRQLTIGAFTAVSGLGVFFLADLVGKAFWQFSLRKYMGLFPATAENLIPTWEKWLAYVLIAGMICPFVEEFFFRGVFFKIARIEAEDGLAFLFHLPVMVILFVLPHANLQVSISAQWFGLLQWSACAMITCCIYHKTRSLLCGWVIHGSANVALYMLSMGII